MSNFGHRPLGLGAPGGYHLSLEERQEHFLAKAREADEKAARAGDLQIKATWEAVAKSWRQLASHLRSLIR